jgi:hypothetical protein
MKRYGKAKTAQLKTLAKLSEQDKAELAMFSSFLNDHKLPLPKLIEKYGAEYLGFHEAELKAYAAEFEPSSQ